jgi:hypothetical protein
MPASAAARTPPLLTRHLYLFPSPLCGSWGRRAAPSLPRGSCAPTRAALFCDARFRGCSYPATPYPAFVSVSLAAVRLWGRAAPSLPRGSCALTRAALFCDARFRGCSYPAAPYPAFVSVSLAAVRLWGRAVLAFACMFVPYVLRVAAGRLSRAFGRASVSACRSVWCVAVRPLCSGATRVLHASLMSTII